MNIKISNIQGLIPFKIFICDGDFNYCELLDDNFRKTTFEMEYEGELSNVGIKIVTSNNKEYRQVFSQKKELFVDCPLEISIQGINPTVGQSDGSAVVTISNCYSQGEILWSDGQTSLIASNLSGGTYSVTVTDTSKDMCFKTQDVTLYEEFYIQAKNCTSITISEFICEDNYQVNWGDGFVSYDSSNTSLSKTYNNFFTGTIIIRTTRLSKIKSFIEQSAIGNITIESTEINKLSGILTLQTNNAQVTGSFSNLPQSLTNLNIVGGIKGDASELPVNLTALTLSTNTFLSGDTSALPRNLIYLNTLSNQIDGNTSNLPIYLTSLTISDFTTIYGSTFGLPRSLKNLIIKGFNTIDGPTGGLPSSLEHCEIWGSNMITGPTLTLPRQLKTVIIAGNNTISGTLTDLPTTLNYMIYFGGANTIGGDITDIPTNVPYIYLAGSGTTVGDIITGNINNLSSGVTSCIIYGNNEITGELLNTSQHTKLISLDIRGNNTISGDTANLPNRIQSLIILGQNNLNTFSSGDTRTYWQSIIQFNILPVIPFDEVNVSNLLQSLVTLNAIPIKPALIKLRGYLNLEDEKTFENYNILINKGFIINISPTL
jgi:hypothetical protein